MKKFLALTMVAMTLLLSACSGSYDRGYDEGYKVGYDYGYGDGKSDGYSKASSEYQDEMEYREGRIIYKAFDDVFGYLVPPEDFADEVGTSYDDFMEYYKWAYETMYHNLSNLSAD
jgi:hypothetical protein